MKNELIENAKILTQENDAFNTYNKGKAIEDFLDLEENQELLSENNLIAIYGEWGSGKSSLMKTIESSLNKEKFKTIWYDTWKYEDEYRIITNQNYLDVKDNIKFIIIGQNLNKQIKDLIKDECTRNDIEVYETYINSTCNKIIIKKYGYEIQLDGSEIKDDLVN